MVLPFKANAGEHGEPPRLLTEEEQILMAIDQGIHEVNDRGCVGRAWAIFLTLLKRTRLIFV